MAEKKATKKKTTKKKTAKKATVKKKAVAKKAGKKKAKKKKSAVVHAKAERRDTQEENSIAPPTKQLVDAFAKYRTTGRRMQSRSTVARLAPGAAPPRPKPVEKAPPPVAAPVTPPPVAQPPVVTPPPVAPAPVAPAPVAQPPVAPPPVAPPPVAKAPPAAPPAAPPQAPPPAAPPQPGSPKAAIPEPKATYKLDPNAPQAPARPAPRPMPRTPKPSKKHKHIKRQAMRSEAVEEKAPGEAKKLVVRTSVTVRELAEKMSVSGNELIKKLISQGAFVTINQRLDAETAMLVASEYGYDLEVKPLEMEETIGGQEKIEDKAEDMESRPPVVTVMGHVDHGKTSLLDAIRDADVVSGESGGITQHIGAYKVKTKKGEVAFLDTPGHAAFTAMRSRGARVTDIVILVVSAADGIQPQTIEAIDHAKEAKVPIIVAVNKVDLPQADPQKVRTELGGRGLNPEEWGGETMYIDVSAKKRQGIDKLLDTVLLQAEMLELKANPNRHAQGTVIEAQMDKLRGTVATVLIQKGTVKVGDPFVMGLAGGKIKALLNDHGERVKAAGPSTPVEVLGITGNIPQAGDTFSVVDNERLAKETVQKRNAVHREEALAHKQHVSLTNITKGGKQELRVVLKADVQGSLEVLKDSLEKMSTEEIHVRVIHGGLGNANEADVMLASASDAIILMFHCKADGRAKEIAEKEGIELRKYDIIYELTEDVKAALEGLLAPEEVEVKVGAIEIRQEFKIRGSRVAGCAVTEGKAVRGAVVKVLREGEEVGAGKLDTLKRFKDDAKEVEKGHECGVAIAGFDAWKSGDIIEVYIIEQRVRRLEVSA
jgi:translation initiation factor IF-2